MTATECLENPAVHTSIEVFAVKLSKVFRYTMDREEAAQELIVNLLERLPQYDPAKSSIQTFATHALQRFASNMAHTRKQTMWANRVQFKVDSHEVRHADCLLEDAVVSKIICDEIESKLKGKARRVFSLLRTGMLKTEAASIVGVHRSYVTRLLQNDVANLVKKYSTKVPLDSI